MAVEHCTLAGRTVLLPGQPRPRRPGPRVVTLIEQFWREPNSAVANESHPGSRQVSQHPRPQRRRNSADKNRCTRGGTQPILSPNLAASAKATTAHFLGITLMQLPVGTTQPEACCYWDCESHCFFNSCKFCAREGEMPVGSRGS